MIKLHLLLFCFLFFIGCNVTCGVEPIDRKDNNKCCQVLLDVSYLVQIPKDKEAMTESGLHELINCCVKMNKYNFCNEVKNEKEREICLSLMKNF